LAFDLNIQQKARESVEAALNKYNGEWCYEAVSEMAYIDQIIDETLRLFPPVTTIHRIVTKDYQLPNGEVLKEGKLVIIPNLAFQRDPKIFPDPMKFDPERFSDEAKATRHSFSSLPFGEGESMRLQVICSYIPPFSGPRYCFGMRYGLLQVKVAIGILLQNYTFSPSDRTDFPIKIDPSTLILAPLGKVWLKISKL
jgi:cytochrome P450 family 6